VPALDLKLRAKDAYRPVGVEYCGVVQLTGDPTRRRAIDVPGAPQRRRGPGTVDRLAHAEREPQAHHNRDHRRQRSAHGFDNIGHLTAPPVSPAVAVSAVIPVWNGRQWLDGCLQSLISQTLSIGEVIAVDNGSTDGSVAHLRSRYPQVHVIALPTNTGFARAVNEGLQVATGEFVALLNTDVILEPDWMQRMVSALLADPDAASVACKMLQLGDDGLVYDAGDLLRRDGACEQRGRFCRDDGSWDDPGEVFGACAGAALYRRGAVRAVGGFDERYFAYLEDVDLAVALRAAGWRCRYEPAVARHAGEGSSSQLSGAHNRLVARNTLLLVAKWFPARWLPMVAYRQAGWLWHAWRERRLRAQLTGLAQGAPLAFGAIVRRVANRRRSDMRTPIGIVVARQPIRGPDAAGHPSHHARAQPGP
jgi:GT2 family glycosyltransferase